MDKKPKKQKLHVFESAAKAMNEGLFERAFREFRLAQASFRRYLKKVSINTGEKMEYQKHRKNFIG